MWGVTLGVQWTESLMYRLTYSAPAQGMKFDGSSEMQEPSDEALEPDEGMKKFYNIVKMVGAPLPKTREATYMLKKKMTIRGKRMTNMSEFLESGASDKERRDAKVEEDYKNRHSDVYVIGTSLAFECVILGLAGFIFVRKDY